MGYNISDVSGNATGGLHNWTFTADLSDPGVTSVSGDFNVISIFGGNDLGEATSGYTFSALSTTAYGTLTYNATDGTFTFIIDRAAVLASGSNQTVSFSITGTSGGNSDTDVIFIQLLICVLRGTRVQTGFGSVAVEDLEVGDMVTTKDNGPQPIRWIGSRKLSAIELAQDKSLRPVGLKAGSLGKGVPERKLSVSPQHRVLVQDWRAELMFGAHEVLVPAKALVNGKTVRVDHSGEPVEYFHLLFDDHQIVFTEGAATESFHPSGYALGELGDAARVELHKLFPDLFDDGCGDVARQTLRPWEAGLIPAIQVEKAG